MRPYRVLDETLDDEEEDELPRVVSLGTSDRGRSSFLGGSSRPQAWVPRDGVVSAPVRRAEPAPVATDTGFTFAQRVMIGIFLIICVGMVLGMLMVRVWDEASQAVASLPPEGSAPPARQSIPTPSLPPAAAPQAAPAVPGTGGITTEIRVLEPNYTVAPGDTLGIIARKHGTSVDALASINNLENRNSLSVGQKLIIP
jgi:hypothetical protein